MSDATVTTALQPLAAPEARVLATLMEKARTVPDTYPLTLNSLVAGCNQKTTRDPVMNLSDAEAQEAVDALVLSGLVRESSGGRVARYEHNFQRRLGVPEQSAVLLGLLMLRGPQTAGELRLNAERWYRFGDISSVEGFLDELQSRSEEKGGPLVVCLPRAAGTREQRWAHLLSGPVVLEAGGRLSAQATGKASGLQEQVDDLTREVAQLRDTVAFLVQELGVTLPTALAGK